MEARKAKKDLFWKRAFDQSTQISNCAYNVALLPFTGWALCLLFAWIGLEASWLGTVELMCFAVALPPALVGFLAQTAAQVAHYRRNAIAKSCGEKPHAFRQETPLGAKLIAGALRKTFNASKTVAKLRPVNVSARSTRSTRLVAAVRNHARAHRSASRATFSFAGASHSSGGGSSGDSSDSGSSDSGDEPPGLTTPASQSLYLFCTQKPHKNPVRERISPNLTSLHVPNGACPDGRCPAWR